MMIIAVAFNGNGKPVFGTQPRTVAPLRTGKVPVGRPAAITGSAPPRPGPAPFIRPKPGQAVTESHLEDALLALPRR